MKNSKLQLAVIGFLALNILSGCEKEATTTSEPVLKQALTKIYYCEKVNYCHGTIQSFVTLDAENKPLSLGVRFSESLLKGLPTDMHNNLKEAMLTVPKEAKDIGIDHIDFGWNPQGHEPDQIYTLPHFDLHFYMVSRKDQAAVVPGPDPIMVSPSFIPVNYISGVVAVPNMGVHYVDVTGPEFNGFPFEKTYIYGFYKGKMTFWEPMFTHSFLLTKPDLTVPVKQPQTFQKSGYYPTSYRISFDADKKEYVVAVEGFKYHEGIKYVPFKGTFQTISQQLNTPSPNQKITGGGETTLGKATFEALSTLVLTPPPPFKSSGTSVTTFENGDKIHVTFTGISVPQPDGKLLVTIYHSITGGTGRFSKASGYYVGTATADRTNPAGSIKLEGEISY